MMREASLLLLYAALGILLLIFLGTRLAGVPPLGAVLDPKSGLYHTARLADAEPPSTVRIPGLTDSLQIVWDERNVPHIFAGNGLDAVAALGYVHAHHRLFQMDFIPRAASGRLSEALGAATIPTDAFLRRTGMEWGAQKNLTRIQRAGGLERDILEAYCRGVNAYVNALASADLPFEFRLLGYEPDQCSPIQPMRVLQYMNYDLSYGTDNPAYGWLQRRLDPHDYRTLYPADPDYSVPIIPSESESGVRANAAQSESGARWERIRSIDRPDAAAGRTGIQPAARRSRFSTTVSSLLEGFIPGKGSNNWVVAGSRSATGKPILAGDMHLSVTLPAIWYEAHIVTPEMNTYGVSIPGAPVLVEAYNEYLGWTFTNTGADQIDHYLLEVDSSETRYRFNGTWRDLELVPDTIHVKDAPPEIDTLRYAHWGPVSKRGGEWIAERWVAHDSSRTLLAVWMMNHARSHDEFQEALRYWDTPMQNILYADTSGVISIRSTGLLPVRRGGSGAGLLDGTSAEGEWIGRVPFDELPFAARPSHGFLTSTNQKPTDSTYPHYLGHDWGGTTYRSIRIDTLLRRKTVHGVRDLQHYQADVHAVQRDFFIPLIDTLRGLSSRADSLRQLLGAWDGEAALDRREPIAFHFFLKELERLAWDESAFDAVRIDPAGDTLAEPARVPTPSQTRLYYLLTNRPTSNWLDVESTLEVESAAGLLRKALEGAASDLAARYGWDTPRWRWEERHGIRFNHLIGALEGLGRGPLPYPGYNATLSPASDTLATHSASWRVVVDFSTSPPFGRGVYPGGQSGNPFSRFYDLHIPTYLAFEYYPLHNGTEPEDVGGAGPHQRTVLFPDSP